MKSIGVGNLDGEIALLSFWKEHVFLDFFYL